MMRENRAHIMSEVFTSLPRGEQYEGNLQKGTRSKGFDKTVNTQQWWPSPRRAYMWRGTVAITKDAKVSIMCSSAHPHKPECMIGLKRDNLITEYWTHAYHDIVTWQETHCTDDLHAYMQTSWDASHLSPQLEIHGLCRNRWCPHDQWCHTTG